MPSFDNTRTVSVSVSGRYFVRFTANDSTPTASGFTRRMCGSALTCDVPSPV
jgi:hypothetical protein